MDRYTARLKVEDVEAGSLPELVSKLSEHAAVSVGGYVMLDGIAGVKIPVELDVVYELGENGVASDLWDLREALELVNVDLSEWTRHKISKPTKLPEGATT